MDTVTQLMQQPITVTLLIASVALVSYILLREKRTASVWPPGPPPLPLLGNLVQLLFTRNMSMIEYLEGCRRQYGNVFTVEFGGVKRVVISGYNNMQEVLIRQAYHSSRRTTQSMPKNYTEIAKKTPGLLWADTPHWKTLRSFALNILRSEGMGKSSLEPIIHHEVDCYIDHFIIPNLGKPISVSDSLMLATANVMGSMILSNRRDYEEPKFLLWLECFGNAVKAAMKAAITRNIPGAAYMPGDLAGIRSDKEAADIVNPQIDESVREHKERLDPKHPVDYIDRFLVHRMKEEEKGNDVSIFTDGNAGVTTLQMYAAGTETTSTALRWVLLYMCVYPEYQQSVQDEIDKVIGSKDVEYKDRLILPFTEAVLLETLRLSNIAPTALPHTLDKEMIIDGKKIPTGSELMLNMASVLSDEAVFDDPNTFNPYRYLTGDIAFKKNRTIPFGIGRRACLGEGLARMELLLFFTTFMQRFRVRSQTGAKLSLVGDCSLVNAPKKFDIIFERRL